MTAQLAAPHRAGTRSAAPVVEVFRDFRFEAAHWLPGVPADHKDARVHGHSYQVRLRLRGPVDERSGYVCDFGRVKAVFGLVDAALDHRTLNEVPGLENPTCELVAVWIWSRVASDLPYLHAVEVRESPWAGCVYRGPAAAESHDRRGDRDDQSADQQR